MTVCIAAVCENGERVVSATDGMLSHVVSADIDAPKMFFLDQALVMVAGHLGNADLMFDELRRKQLSSTTAKAALRNAYRKRMAEWLVDRHLPHFDLEMPEFKKEGRNMLGDALFSEMSKRMESDIANYREQILAAVWGSSPRDLKIYTLDAYGIYSHAYDGMAAIGGGQDVAISSLMVLEQRRHFSLEETLYTVSAAKFSAERCDGVGKTTTMRVSWKRTDKDDPAKPPGQFIQEDQVNELRKIWNRYGKPRIPRQAEPLLLKLADKIAGSPRKVEARSLNMHIRNVKPKRSTPGKSEPGM